MIYDKRNDCLRIGAAPNVDKELLQLLDGIAIEPV